MPAMGMAAMRTPIALSDKGNGVYEGSGYLEAAELADDNPREEKRTNHRQ